MRLYVIHLIWLILTGVFLIFDSELGFKVSFIVSQIWLAVYVAYDLTKKEKPNANR